MTDFKKHHKLLLIFIMCIVIIWSAGLAIFLLFNNGNESGGQSLIASILAIVSAACFYIVGDKVLKKISLSDKKRFIILIIAEIVIFTLIAIKVPYSPSYDSYDMTAFLSQMLRGTTSGYAQAYLSFTVTNKLVKFIYSPYVWIFKNVKIGVQVTNYILILVSLLCINGSVYRIYGKKAGEMSTILLLPFIPYVMLTGPYIYPPAICISSMALFFITGKDILSKVLSYTMCGVLYIIRPTALGALLVYMALYMIISRGGVMKIFYQLENIIFVLAFCIVIKFVLGGVLYTNRLHQYPDLTTSAMIWTAEVGTRLQAEKTGKSTYSGYDVKPFDKISSDFRALWNIYKLNDEKHTKLIEGMNSEIKAQIWERAKSTILSDSETMKFYLTMKYKNLFGDEDKPYYYTDNIANEEFSQNLYKNYTKRYFLYENMLLLTFTTACIFVCILVIFSIIKQRYISKYIYHSIGLMTGVMMMFMLFIIITETGKRLMFDVYTPIAVCTCGTLGVICEKIRKNFAYKFGDVVHKNKTIPILLSVAAVTAMCGVQYIYSLNNIKPFKNCRVYYDYDGIKLVFAQMVTESGYRIWEVNGQTTHLEGEKIVELNAAFNDRNKLELQIPNGDIYIITNMREYK